MSDIFTLEALRARHGDCLILHYGDEDAPLRVLIDGGPSRVWREFLEPRLKELREEDGLEDGDPLRFRMLMVSHIDADHIVGVIDLMRSLQRDKNGNKPIPYRFRTLWHNSFDDALGGKDEADRAVRETSLEVGLTASFDAESMPSDLPGVDDHNAFALASVNQGRQLRLLAEELGVPFNKADGDDPPLLLEGDTADLRDGLTFELLGPNQGQVDALRESWKDFLEARRRKEEEDAEEASVELVEFVDRSVPNLASLVVWAEKDDKVMLLTGDARGDFILEALENTGRLAKGGDDALEVDLLKMPHHGSDRNVADVFFQRIRARHYIFSGDGYHGNPEPATFRLLLENRKPEHGEFTLYLTYPPKDLPKRDDHYDLDDLNEILDEARDRGLDFDVVTPGEDDLSLSVALL